MKIWINFNQQKLTKKRSIKQSTKLKKWKKHKKKEKKHNNNNIINYKGTRATDKNNGNNLTSIEKYKIMLVLISAVYSFKGN